jgi:hypothetical protein
MLKRIADLEDQVTGLKQMMERLLAHHERDQQPAGVSLGGAAHTPQPVHDYWAFYRQTILGNG